MDIGGKMMHRDYLANLFVPRAARKGALYEHQTFTH
jgi:hypothetical protein